MMMRLSPLGCYVMSLCQMTTTHTADSSQAEASGTLCCAAGFICLPAVTQVVVLQLRMLSIVKHNLHLNLWFPASHNNLVSDLIRKLAKTYFHAGEVFIQPGHLSTWELYTPVLIFCTTLQWHFCRAKCHEACIYLHWMTPTWHPVLRLMCVPKHKHARPSATGGQFGDGKGFWNVSLCLRS